MLRCLLDLSELSPLNEEQTMYLVTLLALDTEEVKDPAVADVTNSDPGYRIIYSRLNAANGKASVAAILFLSYISEGIPGRMVSWAYALSCFQFNKKCDMVTLEDLIMDKFCYGFPSEKEYLEVWNAQKIEGLNGYDNYDNWPKL